MFAHVTWKQAVMNEVVDLVNRTGRADFTSGDLGPMHRRLARLFPRNHHVAAKVRQILQYLRDDGLVTFLEPGHYALNGYSPDIDTGIVAGLPAGREVPLARVRRGAVRLRDTMLGLAIKRLYQCRCQVCRAPVPLTRTDYAESHHLRPMGSPHDGPDTPGNILVLCPNHHVMFDRGAAAVEPERLTIVHHRPGIFEPSKRIYLAAPHNLARAHLLYHYEKIFLADSFTG